MRVTTVSCYVGAPVIVWMLLLASAKAADDAADVSELAVPRQLTIVDERGNPVPDALVTVSVSDLPQLELTTNQKGRIEFQYLDRAAVNFRVTKAGYAPLRDHRARRGEPLADQLTLTLPTAITVGGRVVNPAGSPVRDAEVRMSFSERSLGGLPPDRPYIDATHHIVHTDTDGRWSVDIFPRRWQTLVVWVNHPDYVVWEFCGQQEVPIEELLAGTWVVTLPEGFKLFGRLRDERARPIAGAAIAYGPNRTPETSWAVARSDDEGNFTLGAMPGGNVTFVVDADGFTPQRGASVVSATVPPLDLRLTEGDLLNVRFLNEAGEPAQGLEVRIWDYVGDAASEAVGVSYDVDETGLWTWNGMPDVPFKLRVYSSDYVTEEFPIRPTRTEYEFTLQSLPKVQYQGTVLDAETGEAIREFMVVPLSRSLPLYKYEIIYSEQGAFEYEAPTPHGPSSLEVRADGYETSVSGPFEPADSPVELTVKLKRATTK